MDRKVHKDVRDGVAKSFAIPWLESRKQFFIDARHRVVDSDRRQSELNGVGKTGKQNEEDAFQTHRMEFAIDEESWKYFCARHGLR